MRDEGKKNQVDVSLHLDNQNVPTFKQELEFELSELEKDYETMLELRIFIPEELNFILQKIESNKRILSTLSD